MFLHKYSRENVDYLIILKTRTPSTKKTIIEEYLSGIIPIPNEFKKNKISQIEYLSKWMDANTENYRAIVLDMYSQEIFACKLQPQNVIATGN